MREEQCYWEDDPEHDDDLQPVVIPIAGIADEEGEEWTQEIRVWLCRRHREDTAVLGQIAERETRHRTATGQPRLRIRLGPPQTVPVGEDGQPDWDNAEGSIFGEYTEWETPWNDYSNPDLSDE